MTVFLTSRKKERPSKHDYNNFDIARLCRRRMLRHSDLIAH